MAKAAIASRLASEIYGLNILKADIEDEAHNTTRFIILSPETLRAAPGRAVTVVFADRPTPLQAQEIDWDLRQGRLEIRKPLVTGGR